MRRKNNLYLAIGLMIGFFLGAILISVNDGLRSDLFGTAIDTENANDPSIEIRKLKFYLVRYEDAEEWLASLDIERTEELGNDLDKVSGLANAEDLVRYYSDSSNAVDNVLATLHSSVLSQGSSNITTCLALDNNPNSPSGPGLYLYLEVPEINDLDLPDDWQAIDAPPQENILFNKECYQPEES